MQPILYYTAKPELIFNMQNLIITMNRNGQVDKMDKWTNGLVNRNGLMSMDKSLGRCMDNEQLQNHSLNRIAVNEFYV